MLDRLDTIIAFVLSPLHLLGVKRCSKCYLRVRLRQLALLLTAPLDRVAAIHAHRVDWQLVVDPPIQTAESWRQVDLGFGGTNHATGPATRDLVNSSADAGRD